MSFVTAALTWYSPPAAKSRSVRCRMLAIGLIDVSNRGARPMRPRTAFHVFLAGPLLLGLARAATLLPPVITADDLRPRPFVCPDGSCSNNVFCSSRSSLGLGGLTPTASQAAASMCALQGPDYFSGSAADIFMAARFRDSPGRVLILSTDPNTPWMLADYALSFPVQQDKLDSGKRIDGFAQVDLLLCNNASCSSVADLQHIRPSHDDASVLAMGFSGVAFNDDRPGARRTAGVGGFGSIGEEHVQRPPNVAPWARGVDGGDARVVKVQWRAPQSNLWYSTNPPMDGPFLVELEDFAQDSDIGRDWQWLAVGHYRATVLSTITPYTNVNEFDVSGVHCVTILWPRHSWMVGRGWESSDKQCEQQYQAALADRDQPLPPLYVFDSYVNAAHVFLNPRAAAVKTLGTVKVEDAGTGTGTLVYNISVFAGSLADLAGPLKAAAFHDFGGRYGLTYDSDKDTNVLSFPNFGSITQEYDRCIASCPDVSVAACGACDVLSIGTAAIAVRGIQAMDTQSKYSTALHKLRRYALEGNELPWCLLNPYSFVLSNDTDVHVVVQANAANKSEVEQQAGLGGILFDCSLLASLGLGYADRTWDADGRIVPSCSGDACVPASSLATLAGSQLWMDLSSSATDDGSLLHPMLDAGGTSAAAIEQGVQRVVRQAASVLQQRATQELATTDATRRWPGALLDLSVTIVAIVAMASGLRDIHAWLHGKLVWVLGRWAQRRFLWTWVCKPLTALIMLLGLLMAPVFIVISDSNSHALNVDGTSSTVGWLAADTLAPGDDLVDGQYMVVAAVAIRLKSVRDEVAFGLEILNACVAGIASLCILFSLIWRVPFSDHQALPTNFNQNADQASAANPGGGSSDDDMVVALTPSPSTPAPSPLPRSLQLGQIRRN